MKDQKFEILYVPIGVGTFDQTLAKSSFLSSLGLLQGLGETVKAPENILFSPKEVSTFVQGEQPGLVVLQNVTFANAEYTQSLLRAVNAPVLLWTLREPVIDGGRLRLNSLTGAYSAANTMMNLEAGYFDYVFGAPDEAAVLEKLKSVTAAAKLKHALSALKIAAVGHTPQGFGFGRALDTEIQKTFGASLEAIEARELILKAKSYTEEACAPYLLELTEKSCGLHNTPEKNQKDFARLYKAYRDYIEENHIGALASRCWPDFFTEFGTPVCAVLSLLNDAGVACACEGDIYGALSMYIGMFLTGKAAFFGDPVSMDETENTVTYWHCGMAPLSLAEKGCGACIGVHPNRKIGPVMDFACEACDAVTVLRIGRKPDGQFRMFTASGTALQKPKQFSGASVVVRMENPVREMVSQSVQSGWEPHFAVVYGDVREAIQSLAGMLQIEMCAY